LVEQDGRLVVDDGSLAPPPPNSEVKRLLEAGDGEAATALGRTRFSATTLAEPLEHLSLLAFVRASETPFASASLLTSVAALAAILLGAAALVAFTFARDIQSDVTFVRERIVEMASETGEPAGKAVPVRSVDQVGLLTSAFNVLVDRFAAAESAYRADLDGALAYDRERSAFLAALSHELRTPLNAILGFTDVLISEVDGPLSAEAAENLAIVRTSGEHLRSLIDDILDLSALESGELRLSRQRCDVHRIAEDVVREAQAAAASKKLEIRVKGQSAQARVDPRRIRQILTNLVGNALKFTTRGQVLVEVQGKEEYVSLMVSDTGPGIAREEQEAIFEEYRQSGELSVQRAGTGLGLAIVRRLVEMHSGSIGVQSKLGVGSSFAILLPREPPDAPDEPRSAPSHPSVSRSEPPR
jgi:signal transduction histidine kinase